MTGQDGLEDATEGSVSSDSLAATEPCFQAVQEDDKREPKLVQIQEKLIKEKKDGDTSTHDAICALHPMLQEAIDQRDMHRALEIQKQLMELAKG